MCIVCNRNARRDGWRPAPPREEDDEEDDPRPESEASPVQKTVVQPAPSHDGAPIFAAYQVPETTREEEAELRRLRPAFSCVVYDTTHTAHPARSARLARALHERTDMSRRRDKPSNAPDRIEVVTFPMPETASNEERANACVRHYEQEIQSRLAMADKAEVISWLLPERFMDSSWSRMILAINKFNVEEDDDVGVAPWEQALLEKSLSGAPRTADEGRYGSYLHIKWLPQKELFAEVDNPGYTPQKHVNFGLSGISFENIGSGLRDATNEVALFYSHYVGDGLLDHYLQRVRSI